MTAHITPELYLIPNFVCIDEDRRPLTKGELTSQLRQMNPGHDFDTALPQDLVNSLLREADFDARPICVMHYAPGNVFGEIRGFCREWDDKLLSALSSTS